jgi:outer membrane protein assembly factor BamB
MRIQAALFLLASSVVPSSLAIFVDEAYHIDYQHALFGIPQAPSTFFHRPSPSSNASLLYTISEKHVVGAVKPKDGSIVWRQDLKRTASKSATESFLRAADGESIVVSAVGGEVAAWGALDGKQAWENRFDSGPVVDLELAELEKGQVARDAIVLSGGKNGVVRKLDATDGSVRWEYRDERYVGLFILWCMGF